MSGKPGPGDLLEAKRIAGYGDPSGLVGLLFYALSAGPRRRTLRRQRKAKKRLLEQKKQELSECFLAYGRGVHAAAAEKPLPELRKLVGIVDYAVLRQSQMKTERRRKKEREIQDERVVNATKKLAEAALAKNLTDADPEGLRRYRLAEQAVLELRRELWLRRIGIEMYDQKAVFWGRVLLLLPLAFVIAAGISAWLAGELPFLE